MRYNFLLAVLIFLSLTATSQNTMRPVDELINKTEPGWLLVQQWIDSAKNKVEVLSCDTVSAKDALYKTQVTTRSPMGAIIYSTGGLLIDHGWIRILGSGNSKLSRTVPDWNKGKSFKEFGDRPTFLLVADDVVGGFFAVNGGQFGKDAGKIYYLAPDNLVWEALDMTYTEFLHFCFNGDIAKFYDTLRWPNWKDEVENLNGDEVYHFYPFLWTKEGKDINKVSRKAVPIEEHYSLTLHSQKQLGPDK
ncbi:MAG: DUF2625 domain-containing protein [Chitinophagaceae bacterium]|nr:DUF2625 domain-containing protein [Chitinophagaceae bacterium]